MGRIPTRETLRKRNIKVPFRLCGLCDLEVESVEHVFSGCLVALRVWEFVGHWCKAPPVFVFSVRDLLELHLASGLGVLEKKILQGVVIIACWRIWKARNEKVFKGKEIKIEEIIGDIKSLGFLWFKNRSKCKSIDWLKWCKFDLR
ncbi:uncharacterized protein LOC143560980 [Bidens hawaiensis]|uniref:uncharacterized protein LOC143560980 n=1 Tax=Bidens hawaiensis TaxID=980011 RepID=UPI00404AA002